MAIGVTSNIFIDTVNLVARAATSGTALPNVRGKLFAELMLNVRFFDGTGAIIPVDVASVISEIKLVDAPDGSPALLQSSSPVVTGSGNTTLYSFVWDYADGDLLKAALAGATAPVAMICAIQYALSGSTEQIDVPMSFENSYVRPEDQAYDPVAAERWLWLTARATDAGGFAHDDTTRLLSVPGIATNAMAIAAEATARATADTTLQTNINAKADASALATESTARATADTTLQTNINAKADASALTTEATARAAADDLLAPKDSPELTGTPTAPTAAPGTNTTQIANTAFVQAAVAGAGSAIANQGIAYVQNNGNDGTAIIGDPAHPYATPQAAYNAGARVFCFGVGEFGDISGINADIMLIGCGVEQTFVGNISGTAGSVYGNGRENISVGSIYITTANGTNGSVGDPSISLHPTNGTNGSDAPSVIVSGVTSRSDAVVIAGDGGIGGYGGDITGGSGNDGANGGYGGNAGTLTVLDCTLSGYAVCIAGKGGDAGNGSNILDNAGPGGNGGAGGNGGSPGVVNVSRSRVGGFYAAAGTGGSAGAGGTGLTPGSPGPAGNIIGAGTINTDFTKSDNDVTNSETVNYRASLIAGTWNP